MFYQVGSFSSGLMVRFPLALPCAVIRARATQGLLYSSLNSCLPSSQHLTCITNTFFCLREGPLTKPHLPQLAAPKGTSDRVPAQLPWLDSSSLARTGRKEHFENG